MVLWSRREIAELVGHELESALHTVTHQAKLRQSIIIFVATNPALAGLKMVGRTRFELVTNGLKDEYRRLLSVQTQGFQTHAHVTGCHA